MILLIDKSDRFTFTRYHPLGDLGALAEVRRNDAPSIDVALALRPAAIILSPAPARQMRPVSA